MAYNQLTGKSRVSLIYEPPCKSEPRFEQLHAASLTALLSDLGHELPGSYLAFLQEWNGIKFLGDHFGQEVHVPFFNSEDEYDTGHIFTLYGITSEPGHLADIRFAGAGYNFESRVPEHLLAIGDNNHWNRLCISLGPDDFGKIFYWEPGEGWPENEEIHSTEYLRPVAENFESFWSLLTLVEPEDF